MALTRQSSPTRRRMTNVARAYRWVTACVVAAAVLAVLLLVNSVVDYRYVSRLLTVQQVRRELDDTLVALERKLRQNGPAELSLADLLRQSLQQDSATPLWVEIRRPDGTVVVRHGLAGPRLFTSEDEGDYFRDRRALFKVVPVDGGDAVVEVYPLYATGIAALAPPASAPAGPRRSLVAVEIAARLEVRDPSVIWRVRRNLLLNSSAALALLVAAVAAGLGFRNYVRGRKLEEQLEIAREVQTELLPASTQTWDEVGLSTTYRPADQVSGDFYDGFRAADGRIALVMGDVSGKGVPAALVMGVIHGAVRSSTWVGSAADHERESVRLNELLCEKSSGARFANHVLVLLRSADTATALRERGALPGAARRRTRARHRGDEAGVHGHGARPAPGRRLRTSVMRRAPRRRARPLLRRVGGSRKRQRRGVRRGPAVRRAGRHGRRPARARP